MDERGLWELFRRTGLPAAYLAMVGQRREEEPPWQTPAETAFQPRTERV